MERLDLGEEMLDLERGLNQGSGGGMSKGLAEGGVDRITCKGRSPCGLRASCPRDQRMKPPKTGTRSLEKE